MPTKATTVTQTDPSKGKEVEVRHILTKSECIERSINAFEVALARDDRIPRLKVVTALDIGLTKAKAMGTTWVKTEEDILTFIDLIDEIYENPDYTPGKVFDLTKDACFNRQERAKS